MASDNDWDLTLPIDHTRVKDVPSWIRSVKSSTVSVLSSEHRAPSTTNSGVEHVKGSARAYLQSGLPSTRPVGDNLTTGVSTGAEYDDGRLAVNTALSNVLKVYIATSAGISTGWEGVRVGIANTAAALAANTDADMGGYGLTKLGNKKWITALQSGAVYTASNIIQLNSSAVPSIAVGAVLSSAAAPESDAAIANKKYVDDEIVSAIAGVGSLFGVWNDRDKDGIADTVSNNTEYTAATDGFVLAYGTGGGTLPVRGETPTGTIRTYGNYPYAGNPAGLMMPVRNGDTWKVFNADTVYWLPVGA